MRSLTQYWEMSPKSSRAAFSPPSLSPSPSLPLCPPPSLLCFFYKPTSTVSTPGITLQSCEGSSNCIWQGESDLYTVIYCMCTNIELCSCAQCFFFEPGWIICPNTGVSTRANIWMKARVGLHQANQTEISSFMCLLYILNTRRQTICSCSRGRWGTEMCHGWQTTREVCSSCLCRVKTEAVLLFSNMVQWLLYSNL